MEHKLNNNELNSLDGLQGNEWRLEKESSKLVQLNEVIKNIKSLDQ